MLELVRHHGFSAKPSSFDEGRTTFFHARCWGGLHHGWRALRPVVRVLAAQRIERLRKEREAAPPAVTVPSAFPAPSAADAPPAAEPPGEGK